MQAREDFAAERISKDDLRRVEDESIRKIVGMQEEVGLQSATDGEFRRTSWHMDFIYQLDGIDPADEQIRVAFHNEQGDVEFTTAALSVHDRIGLSTTIFGDAFDALKAMTTTAVPKLTIPSPSMVHYRGGRAAISEDLTRTSTSSGPTWSPPTETRCDGWVSSAARISSSTTRASRT